MRPCDRLLHAVTMPAAIGTKIFLLIGVASLLHAKAIGAPLIRSGPNQNLYQVEGGKSGFSLLHAFCCCYQLILAPLALRERHTIR